MLGVYSSSVIKIIVVVCLLHSQFVASNSTTSDYAFMVMIRNIEWKAGFQQKCQGALVHKNWVLSTARCFLHTVDIRKLTHPDDVLILMGYQPIENRLVFHANRTAKDIIVHPEFWPHPDLLVQQRKYDVALAFFEWSVKTSDYIHPIALSVGDTDTIALSVGDTDTIALSVNDTDTIGYTQGSNVTNVESKVMRSKHTLKLLAFLLTHHVSTLNWTEENIYQLFFVDVIQHPCEDFHIFKRQHACFTNEDGIGPCHGTTGSPYVMEDQSLWGLHAFTLDSRIPYGIVPKCGGSPYTLLAVVRLIPVRQWVMDTMNTMHSRCGREKVERHLLITMFVVFLVCSFG